KRKGGGSRRAFKGYAIRWLRFLGRLETPTTVQRPYAAYVDQFVDYMLRERGLSPQTVAYRCRTIHKFLAQIDEAGLRFDTLTVLLRREAVHGAAKAGRLYLPAVFHLPTLGFSVGTIFSN